MRKASYATTVIDMTATAHAAARDRRTRLALEASEARFAAVLDARTARHGSVLAALLAHAGTTHCPTCDAR